MSWQGLVAPAGTPSAIANKLSGAVSEALRAPDVAKHISDANLESIGSTPTELAKFMTQERERWGKVIRATGAKAE